MTANQEARFWLFVTERPAVGCWLWRGSRNNRGYPTFWLAPKSALAHRVAYEHAYGSIPAGMTLDHLCRNKLCVRHDHLEPVTNRENILRGNSPSAKHARQTHCASGHEFTPENTYLWRSGGGERRRCRACLAARTREWVERRGAECR